MAFAKFYHGWLDRLRLLLSQLIETPATSPDPELIARFVSHYADFYATKAQFDTLAVFSAPWQTALERSHNWVGGWRPTTLFHLFYTIFSRAFETRFMDIVNCSTDDLRSISLTPSLLEQITGDISDVSATQLERINALQCETVKREDEITAELARCQEDVSNVARLLANEEPDDSKLAQVLERADELRMQTIKKMVDILRPQQAREFLIGVAELHIGVREMGRRMDSKRQLPSSG